MAEEGMTTAPTDWNDVIDNCPKKSPMMRILWWLQIVGLIVAVFGFVSFFHYPWRLLQLPTLWPLYLAVAGLGLCSLAAIMTGLTRLFGRKSGN